MTDNIDPEILRYYAIIFEKPQKSIDGNLISPSGAYIAAARALRFQADAIERSKEY